MATEKVDRQNYPDIYSRKHTEEKKYTQKLSLIDVKTPKKHITIRAAIKEAT